MDAENLEYKDGSINEIYTSHLLEHISHTKVAEVLKHWYSKLELGGRITINVPDIMWAAEMTLRLCLGASLDGYFTQWEGEHGLQSVLYGSQSHEGEYHKSGFTKESLEGLLLNAGFKDVSVVGSYDGHDMGVLIAKGTK